MKTEKHKDNIMIDENHNLTPDKFGFEKISLSDLKELYKEDDYIPYAQYLRTHNWKSKRFEILDRDNFRCTNCNGFETKYVKNEVETASGAIVKQNLEWDDTIAIFWIDIEGKVRSSNVKQPNGIPDKPYNLHVHHKKYVINKLPWEYENKDLQTLCNYCHLDVHKRMEIPIYNEDGSNVLSYNACDRCGGTGHIPQYKHVQGGICFKCYGARFDILIINKKK